VPNASLKSHTFFVIKITLSVQNPHNLTAYSSYIPTIAPHIFEIAYGRDVVVNSLKRHYDVLVRMAYLDPAVIEYPPPSGLSDDQLAADILCSLGRSENAID
jgi:hypothetical protein